MVICCRTGQAAGAYRLNGSGVWPGQCGWRNLDCCHGYWVSYAGGISDTRILGMSTNAGKRRKLQWRELCMKAQEENFSDWPVPGPRTVRWCLDFLNRRGGGPLDHHKWWVSTHRLTDDLWGVAEHEWIMKMADSAGCYDQVDLCNLSHMEWAFRRAQLIEHTYSEHRSALDTASWSRVTGCPEGYLAMLEQFRAGAVMAGSSKLKTLNEPSIPPGWKVYFNTSYNHWFFADSTGAVRWTHPIDGCTYCKGQPSAAPRSVAPAPPPPRPSAPAVAAAPLRAAMEVGETMASPMLLEWVAKEVEKEAHTPFASVK